MLEEFVDAGRDHSVSVPEVDLVELIDRSGKFVVDDHMPELVTGGELCLGDLEAPCDRIGILGAARRQALAQLLERARRDEDRHRLGNRRAHLPGPLELDLEHHRDAAAPAPLELRPQRAVAVAGVARVLDELAGGEPAVEVLFGEEVVGDPVLLAAAGRAGGRGDRERELGVALAQRSDEGALANPGGAGD